MLRRNESVARGGVDGSLILLYRFYGLEPNQLPIKLVSCAVVRRTIIFSLAALRICVRHGQYI